MFSTCFKSVCYLNFTVPVTPEQFEVFWVDAWCPDYPQYFDATMWNTKNLIIASISTLTQ